MIPDSFKQGLLNRVDIVDLVSRYVRLKKGGANYQGLCPFHTEKTPSFTVSPTKQFYHCFGCGAHGNAIGFLMAYSGLGYIDAVKELASSAGMQMPEWQPRTPEQAARKEREPDLYAVMEKAMDFYRAELKKSSRAIEYLKGRGLSGEIAARFRIGYAPDDWQGLRAAFPEYEDKALVETGLVIVNDEGKRYDRFRDRVMFPILNARGAVIGFGGRVMGEGEPTTGESKGPPGPKYLNSPETALFEKGREVYGLVQAREAIRAAGRVLVVEGYMDVVALAQFGVGCAVATLGTATTPIHVSKLLRLADEVVFCFDGDAAGRKAAWRALEVSLPLATDAKPLKFLFLPEREDPDSFVRAQGQEAFERLAREAQTLSGFLLGELRGGADLGTPEGRSRFVVSAKPHLQRIAAPGLKLQLVKEVATMARLSQEEAERLLELRSAPVWSRPAPPRAEQPLPVSLEWKLLTRVFARPELALEIDSALLKADLPESQALLELIERLQAEDDPASIQESALVEMIEQTRHARLLGRAQAALSFDLKLSMEDAVAEFRELLEALRRREPEADRLLRQKVLQGTASAEERLVFERKIARDGVAKPLN